MVHQYIDGISNSRARFSHKELVLIWNRRDIRNNPKILLIFSHQELNPVQETPEE